MADNRIVILEADSSRHLEQQIIEYINKERIPDGIDINYEYEVDSGKYSVLITYIRP